MEYIIYTIIILLDIIIIRLDMIIFLTNNYSTSITSQNDVLQWILQVFDKNMNSSNTLQF